MKMGRDWPVNSPYQKIEQLKKGRFLYQRHRDTILMQPWIEILLNGAHQPDAAQFFETMEPRDKVNEAILPLFFHKADAVGITRRALNMAEGLNPKLGRELRILAVSPRLISNGFLFRKGVNDVDRRTTFNALTAVGSSLTGRQLLALYESRGFVLCPGPAMNPTFDLIRQYERIKK
jgi:ABC-type phosphate/phosphonate transport system substrate-binding protein